MADKATEKPEAPAPVVDAQEAQATESKPEQTELGAKDDAKPEEPTGPEPPSADGDKGADIADEDKGDSAAKADTNAAEESAPAEAPVVKSPSVAKAQPRRKSGGAAANRKSLSKKASKARITHLDAKPGDHFLVKLKGFPEWPAVICDESMLPHALITSRPVTAARPDGTFGELYADGGKRAADRNFPVMYLFTNEFGWVVNTALTELTAEMAENTLKGKLRKDLRSAFELAAEQHPLQYFKDVLQRFEEEYIAHQRALEEAALTPKPKKGKAKKIDADGDEEMAEAVESTKKSAKKRKAEDDAATPQRSDSVKKPKIKLNTSSTPKAANGTGTPQPKDAAAKASKPKPKKAKDGNEKKAEAKDKMTPEEKHARKEKEVLYLRHKLQRGLLTGGDQTPKPEDMPQMSDYITMLENFVGLEVSIIRATKINKVLKAILKLESIPREDEYKFKSRSQKLLEKWNKLLAGDGAAAPASATNGVNGTSESHKTEKPAESVNKKEGSAAPKDEPAAPEKAAESDATKASEEAPVAAEAEPTAA